MAQMPLFTGMPRAWYLATLFCAVATIGDVLIVVGLVALGELLFSDKRWFAPTRIGRYAVIALTGTVAHVTIEWVAVEKLELWGYQPWHPRLPLVGTGLIAIVQPLVVIPIVLWLAARWEAHLSRRE